jgi:hypothetical protein
MGTIIELSTSIPNTMKLQMQSGIPVEGEVPAPLEALRFVLTFGFGKLEGCNVF